MKKCIIVFLIVFLLGFVFKKDVSANQQIKSGLGYSYNMVKSPYLDATYIKDGSPIFDEEWINNLVNKVLPIDDKKTNSAVTYTSNTARNIATKLSYAYMDSSNFGSVYQIGLENLKAGYNVSSYKNYEELNHQYYYVLKQDIYSYICSLPNYSSNLTEYKNHFHEDYLNALDLMFKTNTYEAAETFFDTYGTHLIAKAIYGGRIDLFLGLFSSVFDIDNSYKKDINATIKLGITDNFGSDKVLNFNYQDVLGETDNSVDYEYRVITYGGMPFSASDINLLNEKYDEWLKTIYDYPALIGTTADGLIPLWNLLPEKYDTNLYHDRLKIWLGSYATKYNNTIYDLFGSGKSELPTSKYESNSKLIRENEYLITDDGRFKNKYDTVDLNKGFGYTYQKLVNELGFTKMDINITFQMCEIDKGYQHVFLFSSDISSNDYLISQKDIEYCGDDLGSTYGEISILFEDILASNFKDNAKLYIRYGASGEKDDDWKNKDVNVKITYHN